MADVVVSDLKYDQAEINLLADVAQNVFKFDEKTFLNLMQKSIQYRFRPSLESISGL
jgi:hypothetical protein